MADLSELMAREALQQLPPTILQQVVFHFHDHVIARQHRRHHRNHLLDSVIVQEGEAEVEIRLVVVGPLREAALPLQAALLGPVQEGAVAELDVAPVLRHEAVQPIERALVRQAHGHNDLPLAVLRLGCLLDHAVRDRGLLDGEAFERKRPHDVLAQVDLQSDIPVGHSRVKRLAAQGLGQRLRLRDALAAAEEGDRVGIRARGIQVQEHCDNLAVAELLRDPLHSRLAVHEEALAVEADILEAVGQDQGGLLGGEAHADEVFRLRALHPASRRLAGIFVLRDHDLKHVATSLETDARPGAREEVLEAAVGEGHQVLAIARLHDVEGCVLGVERTCPSLDLRPLHRWRILLSLD
mmetsp:Transcript_110983/g.277836  ORF Transcript_110983/g.277836 Transcript_110983/m.277836 type:complete len:354 (-) Transcript_110983:119-1180(-)